jgi:hypothetical protein
MRLESKNFILGAGKEFVETISPPAIVPRFNPPYTPEEARSRIQPRLAETVISLRQVPAAALPSGEAVAKITLHPQYLSKSAFPSDLIREAGLHAIGSKATRILPEKVGRKSEAVDEATAEIYVAGTVSSFESFAEQLRQPVERLKKDVQTDLASVEALAAMTQDDRLAPTDSLRSARVLECILHTPAAQNREEIIAAFQKYAASLGLDIDQRLILNTSGLSFLSITGNMEAVRELAWFSFLRKIRPMPRMRPLLPTTISRATTGLPVVIPQGPPLDLSIKAAVFDAALPKDHALGHWVNSISYAVPDYLNDDEKLHGMCVTSAATLGPLERATGNHSPYALDHHGVLGEDPNETGYHAALQAIQRTVINNDYRLINLSFGPDGAYLDDDVDPFTIIVDELTADGKRLAFIAVGNSGDLDDSLGLNKIQPPSDAINAISVGAADTRRSDWNRADYSCVGPGRLGCMVKPDFINFGGSVDEPFGCIGAGSNPERHNVAGTSFSSPAAMRIAGGIMAAMGQQVSPIAVKAIMVHGSRLEGREHREVGHGILATDIADMLICDPNEVKVLFQGSLAPGKYVRHDIPTPVGFTGLVELSATLCFASQTDANFPTAYAQAGVAATFRPHAQKRGQRIDEDGTVHESTIKTVPLFSQGKVYGTTADRRDAHLWDTVLKTQRNFQSKSILDPSIDLHYNRRSAGQATTGQNQPDIPYALIITLRCKAVVDLYNQVVARYGNSLQVLAPRAEVAIRI